jgi:hypothetical protein
VFNAAGSASITIGAPSGMGNDAAVTYSLRVMHDLGPGYTVKGYVQLDGTVGAGEVFLTLAAWGATVTITGLTVTIPYTVAARAQNELAVFSAWSAESAPMNCSLELNMDYGLESAAIDREVTGGNVKVDDVAGVTIGAAALTCPEATNGETWYHGSVPIDYTLLSYENDTAAIEGEFSEDGGATWADATLSGGDGTSGLTSSPTGVAHDVNWDSYTDAGTSEYQTDMMLRLHAQDAEGDWGPWVETAVFTIYNLPAVAVATNYDGRDWDEDATPTFMAIIPSLRGGTVGYPEISIYESDGSTLVNFYPKRSSESIVGWEYETAPNTWVSMALTGIPTASINGVNRMRYTVQAALAAGDYKVSFRLGELRDLG